MKKWMAMLALLGCPDNGSIADDALVGSWRIYSETLYNTEGGGQLKQPVTRELELGADGVWQFGSSEGTWSVEPIEDADWERWGVSAYEPTRKIVLDGWNDAVADGPIEESASGVDFVWVIYAVDEPEPGVVFMKFGH